MNIKSLLLGSATAFAVVSGAQAADAIVAAAPEPMEYVKVCDAFGTGYFYIPGTETCLKISGLVRYQLNYSSAPLVGAASPVNPGYKWSTYTGNTMFRVHVEAKNDSELGTVYSFIRIQGNAGSVAGNQINTARTTTATTLASTLVSIPARPASKSVHGTATGPASSATAASPITVVRTSSSATPTLPSSARLATSPTRLALTTSPTRLARPLV